MSDLYCRIGDRCASLPHFLCDCSEDKYSCDGCLVAHIAACQHINLENEEKIFVLADHESRTKVVSDINEFIEKVESLKYDNLSEYGKEMGIVKEKFLAKIQAMSELSAHAGSTIGSLNHPLEGGIIKFNKTTISFLNEFFSENQLKDRIAVEYSLESGIVLKGEILKRERDLQELLDESNKELESLRKGYGQAIERENRFTEVSMMSKEEISQLNDANSKLLEVRDKEVKELGSLRIEYSQAIEREKKLSKEEITQLNDTN